MTAPRLLSSWPARRLGPQLPLDVSAGRAPRHAQGWNDQPDPEDELRAARGIIFGSAVGAAIWVGLILLLALLSGCGGADIPPNPNTITCYRCSFANSALVETSYACTPADAQQFGRRCFR